MKRGAADERLTSFSYIAKNRSDWTESWAVHFFKQATTIVMIIRTSTRI